MCLLKRSCGEGFVSPQGLPFSLPPFFLSQSLPPAPVAPMARGFVVGSKAGGGLGDDPATLKRGIGQGLLPTGARSQGEEERGRGLPTCSHSSPSQAAFLLALAAWPPETYPLEPGLAYYHILIGWCFLARDCTSTPISFRGN